MSYFDSNFNHNIIIAIVAAMINIIFSLIIPALLSINSVNNVIPFSTAIKKHYENNRDIIIVSSLFVIVFVYLSLVVTPLIENNIFKNIAQLGNK